MFPVNEAYDGVLCVDVTVFHVQVFKWHGTQRFAGVLISNPGGLHRVTENHNKWSLKVEK